MTEHVIPTPDQRVRVFVSSTLTELAAERQAVRDAVTSLRLVPVMFELGARPHPPGDVYRAYLAQSQVFVGNERPYSGVGRAGLAKQVQACLALLPAETGLEGYPVDVEDHSSHLLISHRDGTDLFRMSLVAVSPL